VHPNEAGKPGHELYLLCDDIDATVKDLKSKRVTVEPRLYDQPWGAWRSSDYQAAASLGFTSHGTRARRSGRFRNLWSRKR